MKMARYYHSVAVLRKMTSQGGYKSELIIIGGENTECPYFDTKHEKIGAVIDAAFETVKDSHHSNNNPHLSNKKRSNSVKKPNQ